MTIMQGIGYTLNPKASTLNHKGYRDLQGPPTHPKAPCAHVVYVYLGGSYRVQGLRFRVLLGQSIYRMGAWSLRDTHVEKKLQG